MKACFAPGVTGLLAPIQAYLDDPQISEIMINCPEEIFIEDQNGIHRIASPILTSNYLRRLFTFIANENKLTLSESSPTLSGSLKDGSRVQLVIPPAAQHETLSIRKFNIPRLSFDDYAAQQFFEESPSHLNEQQPQALVALYQHKNWQAFLSQAIQTKQTILISGATSSGKTTFLNTCLNQIPTDERLVTLEDTFEIMLPHPNIVRLKSNPKTEGLSTQDLVQTALRLRPDRIIMGEIRGKEIFDFICACSTGHKGSIATIHANNPQGAFMRMAQLYKLNPVSSMKEDEIYQILKEAIDIIVQLQKTDQGRRLTEVYYKHAT